MSVAESLFWPVSVFPTEFVGLCAYRRISVLDCVSVANSVCLSESVLPSQCYADSFCWSVSVLTRECVGLYAC